MNNIKQIIQSHNKSILQPKNNQNSICNCQRKTECPLNGSCVVDNVVYAAIVCTQGPNSNQPTTTTNPQPTRHSERYSLRTLPNTRTTIDAEPDQDDPIATTDTTTTTEPTNTPRNDRTNHNLHNRTMTYIGAAENFKNRYRNHQKSFRHPKYEKDTELSKYIKTLNENKINFSIKWKIIKKTTGYNQITKSCNLCIAEKFELIKFKDKNNLLNKRNELISKCRHENKYLLANLADR